MDNRSECPSRRIPIGWNVRGATQPSKLSFRPTHSSLIPPLPRHRWVSQRGQAASRGPALRLAGSPQSWNLPPSRLPASGNLALFIRPSSTSFSVLLRVHSGAIPPHAGHAIGTVKSRLSAIKEATQPPQRPCPGMHLAISHTAICATNSRLHRQHYDALRVQICASQNRNLPPPERTAGADFPPLLWLIPRPIPPPNRRPPVARSGPISNPTLWNSRAYRGMRTTNISPAGQWGLLTVVSPWIPQSRDPPPPASSVPGGADGEMELRRGSVPHAGDHE